MGQHHIHKKNGTAAIRGRAIPCSGQRFKEKRCRHSTQWRSLVVFHGQVGAQPFTDKTAGAIGGDEISAEAAAPWPNEWFAFVHWL